jgi:nucleoid-associated protein YgaU
MPRTKKITTKATDSTGSYFDKLESDIRSNQSALNLVLGALIVLVVGVLVFNYFNKNKAGDVGPAQQTQEQQGDVSADKLPGKYTVKDGDTLFSIAENYYKDGYKYSEIAKANNMSDVNALAAGQVLEIPKIEGVAAATSPAPSTSAVATPAPAVNSVPAGEKGADLGTGGATNVTIWGTKIDGDTYTVVEGDWLSKIAGRAYGDVMAYQKIAQANNISNPDLIAPGMTLKLPR